jgi:hypothetical protein
MVTLDRKTLKAARSAFRWGSCKSMKDKTYLFRTFEHERPIYLAVEEELSTLLSQFDDSLAKIALNTMDEQKRISVLTSTALNFSGQDAARLLSFLDKKEGVTTLIHAHVPGAIQIVLRALTPKSKAAVVAEMTKQLMPIKESIMEAQEQRPGGNYLPVTDQIIMSLPDCLRECSGCGKKFTLETVAITIENCLEHAYHMACEAFHDKINCLAGGTVVQSRAESVSGFTL